MEPYIENISLDTVQQNYESLCHFQRKKIIHSLIIWAAGFVLFFALYFSRDSVLYLIAALVYGGMFVWQLIKPRYVAKKVYNRKLAYYNQTMPPITYRFYDDHFEVSDIDSNHTVTYDKIKAVVMLKTCVALQLADGRGFLISSNGFQKGTLETFQSFIRGKCPQINPAQWQW